MNAWALVAGWAEVRANELREAARKAATSYTQDPMKRACAAYAASLAVAAAMIEDDARELRRRAAEATGLAGTAKPIATTGENA